MMSDQLITTQSRFDQLLDHIAESGLVGFDTEFVSEYSYRPQLCLLQFATEDQQVSVDPLALDNLDRWWQLMCDPQLTVIVHGGQAEVRFCFWAIDDGPQSLVDVQLAEGLLSQSYPLAYTTLLERVLGKRVSSHATRTDWRKRPLSSEQIRYAIDDVRHLLSIWQRQKQRLQSKGRLDWAVSEFSDYVHDLVQELSEDQWRKLSGIQRLNRRQAATVRELFAWRESEALKQNKQPRKVLRDDLLMDMARRAPRSVPEVLATRDMSRPSFRKTARQIVECVEAAQQVPDQDLPRVKRESSGRQHENEQVLAKLLSIALANRCAELDLAPQLIATSADLKQLVRAHLTGKPAPQKLTEGWRAEVCGNLLTDVLQGRITMRVADPQSSHPLVMERAERESTAEH